MMNLAQCAVNDLKNNISHAPLVIIYDSPALNMRKKTAPLLHHIQARQRLVTVQSENVLLAQVLYIEYLAEVNRTFCLYPGYNVCIDYAW